LSGLFIFTVAMSSDFDTVTNDMSKLQARGN